ncbi:MAG TPA: hypothetical protein VKG44_07145 [Candidatus Baltobacteraceae bacterium]|nr:hypothetical protein [Candidatus Baltobacteraceae bacterium]
MSKRPAYRTAQLLGCAVAILGFSLTSDPARVLAAATPEPHEGFAACVRNTPGRPDRAVVEACLSAVGYNPVPADAGPAIRCTLERYPGGDLGGCLDLIAEQPGQVSGAPAAPAGSPATPSPEATVAPGGVGAGSAAPSTVPIVVGTPAPQVEETPVPATTAVADGEVPWWPLGVAFLLGALMAAAITYFALRGERDRVAGEGVAVASDDDHHLPAGVRIATPQDFSVHPSGGPVALTANAVPPARAASVSWTVTSPDNRVIASGTGGQFAFTATATGVYHIVARLDRAADDLLLFIYETPTGGAGLADLLGAQPPPFPREPTGFVWNRSRTL